MRYVFSCLAAAGALCLTACAGPGAPALPLTPPASLSGPLAQGQAAWPQGAWWRAFADPQLDALIEQIDPLLAANKFDAFAVFRQLQELAAGSSIEEEMDHIGQILNRCDYASTRVRLRQLQVAQSTEVPYPESL